MSYPQKQVDVLSLILLVMPIPVLDSIVWFTGPGPSWCGWSSHNFLMWQQLMWVGLVQMRKK